MIRRKYIFVTAFWAILYFDPYLFQAPVLVQKYKNSFQFSHYALLTEIIYVVHECIAREHKVNVIIKIILKNYLSLKMSRQHFNK